MGNIVRKTKKKQIVLEAVSYLKMFTEGGFEGEVRTNPASFF